MLQKQENQRIEAILDKIKQDLDQREIKISRRIREQEQFEKDTQAKYTEKLKDAIESIQCRANEEILEFRKKYFGVFAVLCIICAIQLVLNAFVSIDYTLLQTRRAMFVDTFYGILESGSMGQVILIFVILTAVMILLGYQYFKRFRDEFTLFAVLADIILVEYAAVPLVNNGWSLSIAFWFLQGMYLGVRDIASSNSFIRFLYNVFTGNV